MKNVVDMLEQYKDEKAFVTGGCPLEEAKFERFASWRSVYEQEYDETHRTVSVQEADLLVEQAQKECDGLNINSKDSSENNVDLGNRTRDNTLNAEEQRQHTNTPPTQLKHRRYNIMTAKTNVAENANVAENTSAPVLAAAKAPSKADIARDIYRREYAGIQAGKVARKQVIAMFVAEANLTQAGASTYYQNFKKKAEEEAAAAAATSGEGDTPTEDPVQEPEEAQAEGGSEAQASAEELEEEHEEVETA